MLKRAIRDNSPVIFIEPETLCGAKGEAPEDADCLIPLGVAEVKREGRDVTAIAYSGMYYRVLEAAEEVERTDGISVEIIDPRTLRPMDVDTILASVRKTHRALVAESGAGFAGMGSEIAAFITESAVDEPAAPAPRGAGPAPPRPPPPSVAGAPPRWPPPPAPASFPISAATRSACGLASVAASG